MKGERVSRAWNDDVLAAADSASQLLVEIELPQSSLPPRRSRPLPLTMGEEGAARIPR